jgi:hypothetical protein
MLSFEEKNEMVTLAAWIFVWIGFINDLTSSLHVLTPIPNVGLERICRRTLNKPLKTSLHMVAQTNGGKPARSSNLSERRPSKPTPKRIGFAAKNIMSLSWRVFNVEVPLSSDPGKGNSLTSYLDL